MATDDDQTDTAQARLGLRVWVLALGMFAIGTDLFIVSGLLPDVGDDLDLSVGAAGQTVTVFAVTYAVLAPVLTGVTARFDRRLLLLAVLLVFGIGNVVSALAPTFPVLLASRVVAASGAALFAGTASTVAARIAPPERRGRALAIVYAGMTSAIALGVPIGNAIGNAASWRWAFVFVAALAGLTAIGIFASLPALSGTEGIRLGQRLAAARIPQAPATLVVTALWVLGTFTVYTYLAAILDNVTHAPTTDRPWLLLLFGAGSFLGVMVGGRIADRFNDTHALAVSIGLLTLILIGIGVTLTSLPATAIGLAVWGLVHWTSFPLLQHRLLAIGGKRGDMLLALNNSAVYTGQTLAAVIGGFLASDGGPRDLPYTAAAIELAALVVLGIVIWTRRRQATLNGVPAAHMPTRSTASR